ncbi:MAG: four helix bundle protein [Bacteroides sp.]|nr:four helix bundle protein [Bacteroides sp.]MCM1380148.1 four helix bundle protein [Bacteroides sp.]MCM1445730.1 four helix bundle protein [Prevotella sp.]
MDVFSFEKLQVYQLSKELVARVYNILNLFPQEELYCLSAQIRRAVVSVPSNIAEGCGRCSYKEKIHFIEIAYASMLETFCQLDIAVTLGYIDRETLEALRPLYFDISFKLTNLKNSYKSVLNGAKRP